MSRSHKKTPVLPIASSDGEKEYKKQRNRAERARVRGLLAHDNYDLARFRQVHSNSRTNMWGAACDGKRYWTQDRFDHYEERTGITKEWVMRK